MSGAKVDDNDVLCDERGSAAAEFVLIGALLAALAVAVIQFALAVHVRNVVHDAAVAGAYQAALADATLDDGAVRTRSIIERAIGAAYAGEVTAAEVIVDGERQVEVVVRSAYPAIGLIALPGIVEVRAHAPVSAAATDE